MSSNRLNIAIKFLHIMNLLLLHLLQYHCEAAIINLHPLYNFEDVLFCALFKVADGKAIDDHSCQVTVCIGQNAITGF